MKKYILIFIIGLLFLQCKKSTFNDLAGSQVLKGNVVIYDTLNGAWNKILAKNYKVFLKYSDASGGFLYSVTANAQAEFSFSGIDPARSYVIFAASDTGVVKYYGENVYTAGSYTDNQSDTLRIYPSDNNQNGIHLIVTDNQLQRIPNTNAWVFNSAILFSADTSAGRVFDIPTNNFGVGNKLNIPAGTYYLRIKTRIGGLDLAGEDTVQVPAIGIINSMIALKNTPLPRNGIEAVISDIFNTPVADAKVYCYRSQFIFENDTTNYNSSLFTMTSNQSGLAATYVIEPGIYYLRAVKIINSIKLTKTAIVPVNAATVSRIPMTIQQ